MPIPTELLLKEQMRAIEDMKQTEDAVESEKKKKSRRGGKKHKKMIIVCEKCHLIECCCEDDKLQVLKDDAEALSRGYTPVNENGDIRWKKTKAVHFRQAQAD
jgi:hypothetical protein